MTPALHEAACALRRFTRRRTAAAAALLDAALLGYAAVVRPVTGARDAVSAATAIAALTVLVMATGVIAEDRGRGRLAVVATHPAPPGVWVVGRWLAVCAVAAAAQVAAMAVLLGVAGGPRAVVPILAATAASLAHLAALAAVAVGLSCRLGSAPQLLALLAVLVLGAVPPDVAARAVPADWAGGLARVLWAALPTSWALGRLHAWALSGGGPAPLLALALLPQCLVWLAAGTRDLRRADLAPRNG